MATTPTPSRVSTLQKSLLMLLHTYAIGVHIIPLPMVLRSHGLEAYLVYPFIFSSIASFISPLIFGSLADRRFAPERLMAVLVFGGSILMASLGWILHRQMGASAYLTTAACYQLWMAPAWGLLNGIGLSGLLNPQSEFGKIRVWGTIGFMIGGLSVSFLLGTDKSPFNSFIGAGVYFLEGLYLLSLPPSRPDPAARAKNWREVLGWEAFDLLKNPNHRSIFVASALFNAPLAVFYVLTPYQLEALDDSSPSRTMSMAQYMEIVSILGMAAIMTKFRLKWLLAAGIFLGAVRYGLNMLHYKPAIITGIILHGLIFTLFFMTTQIYMEQRIETAMRNQAQALLSLMTNGVGALSGYLVLQWWYRQCVPLGELGTQVQWVQFWGPPTLFILLTLVWFLLSYHGAKQ
jgi:hypothetical protein